MIRVMVHAAAIACLAAAALLPGCGGDPGGGGPPPAPTAGASNLGGTGAMGGLAQGEGGASATGGGSSTTTILPRSIVASNQGTCVLDEAGSIQCWGAGSTDWPTRPAGSFVALHTSGDLVCGIRSDGTVECFGEPNIQNTLEYVPKVPVINLGLSRSVICGIDTTGATFCDWEKDGWTDMTPPPDPLVEIAVGYDFACGIKQADSSILCWGSAGVDCDAVGQLESPAGQYIAISSRNDFSCAVDTQGQLHCWGADVPTDPGLGCESTDYGQTNPPGGNYTAVTVGLYHACALAVDGTVACWGAGSTDACPQDGPQCRQALAPEGQFVQVAAGALHTCAMRADRTVACWGSDRAGDGRIYPPPEFL